MGQDLQVLMNLDKDVLIVIVTAVIGIAYLLGWMHVKSCDKRDKRITDSITLVGVRSEAAVAEARAESAAGDKRIEDRFDTIELKHDKVAQDLAEVVGYIKGKEKA